MKALRHSITPLFLLAAGLLPAAPAAGQVTVIGNGYGKDCYEAVMKSDSRAEQTCDLALSSGGLDMRDRAATYVNRAILRMRDGRYEASESDLDRASKLSPGLADIALNYGALRLYQDRPEDALAYLNAAIDGASQPHAAYYNRAIARERLGDITAAYFDYKRALELKPGWALASAQLERFTVQTN